MQAPTSMRLLAAPGRVFDEIAASGRGFGALLGFLAIEAALVMPDVVVRNITVATYEPIGGLSGLYSTYVAYALKPALIVFALAAFTYFILRGRTRAIELWGVAGVAAYTWVPHVPLVAIGALLAALGFDHPLLPHHRFAGLGGWMVPAKFAVEFGPTLALAAFAVRRFRAPLADTDAGRGNPLVVPWLATVVTLGLIIVATTIAGNRIRNNWDAVRPVMPQDRLPGFVIRGLEDGSLLRHADLSGQVTLIDFWATWCPPCVEAMPGLSKLHEELGPRGLRTLSVNIEPDNLGAVREFARERKLPFPVYIDGGTMRMRFKVETFPTVFLVDKAGHVRHVHVGVTSMGTLRREVDALLGEAG